MKIIRATLKDLDKIAELMLEYDLYEHSLDKNVEKMNLGEIKKMEKKHLELGTEYFFVEDNNKIIGLIDINIDKRGKENMGVIHTLIITNEARGNGYGSKIVKYVFDYFKKKGCSRVRTFVHLANKNAKKFWEKQDFELECGYNATRRLK